MSLSYKYRMLSGLESSGGANMVWAEGATAAELATATGASGSIGTLTGDPDSLYVYDGNTWRLIDKEGLAAGVLYEGISPQTLLLANKLAGTVGKRLLDLLPTGAPTTSASSSGVAITDAVEGYNFRVTAGALLTQSSGGQTFAAPEEITGIDTLTITHTYGEAGDDDYAVTPITPMYGLTGKEDYYQSDTGVLSRKVKHVILNGTESWTAGAEGVKPYVLTLADKAAGTTNFACSHSVPAASGTTEETCVGAAAAKTITFNPNVGEAYNTLDEWKALLAAEIVAETPVQLVYELADELVEYYTPMVISAQAGTNTLVHDGDGAITVEYVREATDTVWAPWTPTLTWTDGTPDSLTTVARYMQSNKTVFFNFFTSSADANGATALTISLPVAPKINNSFIPVTALQKQNTTWSDPKAFIDDSASVIAFYTLTTCTDDQAVIVMASGQYEIA